MGPHDGSDSCWVLLLAAADGQHVRAILTAVVLISDAY